MYPTPHAASFPIAPDSELYPIDSRDPGIREYLQQAETSYEDDEHMCFYCNVREGTMFPLFFESA